MLIEVEGVGKAFFDGKDRREVLRGVDLAVAPGEMTVLLGPSGCGKTTLLTLMAGLDVDFTGEIRVLGRRIKQISDDERTQLRNECFGFVFQSFHLLDHLTVAQNVAVPLWLRAAALRASEERARVVEALEMVSLADRLGEPVRRLSGGERQRVAIARALVNQPRILLADEPTGNLDAVTGALIAGLFDRVLRGRDGTPCSVIIATHDRRLAARAGRVFRLTERRLEEVVERADLEALAD